MVPVSILPPILPDDLIAEILSLLDVKSLKKLKCVSKSWNSLFSDPSFIQMHLKKSSQNPHITLCSSNEGYFTLNPFPIRSLLENRFMDHPDRYQFVDRGCSRFVGSCNGLICMLSDRIDGKYQSSCLCFWNPATRSVSKRLGYSYVELRDKYLYLKFSFGYDNTTGKYKVVAYSPGIAKMFSLGDHVWRSIKSFPATPFRCTRSIQTGLDQNGGVYFCNSLNWFTLCNNMVYLYSDWKDLNDTIEQFGIISLDLGTEKCTQMLLPQDFDEIPPIMPIVCVLADCLCFCHYSKENDFVIWQMRKFRVEESWTMFLKFSYQNIRVGSRSFEDRHLFPLYLSENCNTLILVSDRGHVVFYNKRENRVERSDLIRGIYRLIAKEYVESLVLTC